MESVRKKNKKKQVGGRNERKDRKERLEFKIQLASARNIGVFIPVNLW